MKEFVKQEMTQMEQKYAARLANYDRILRGADNDAAGQKENLKSIQDMTINRFIKLEKAMNQQDKRIVGFEK